MRDIKFRGKTVNEREWIYSITIANGTIKRKKDWVFMGLPDGTYKQVDPKTVGQYTGVKDCEKEEIAEGDEVGVMLDRLGDDYNLKENDYMICQVIFESGGFHLLNNDREAQFPLWAVNSEALKIIGNIHTNQQTT